MYAQTQFVNACRNGDLQKAKHLLSTNHTINILENIKNEFKNACKNGYLHIAEWLFSLKQNQYINMSIFDTETFVWTCGYGHLQVAKYLYKINSNINISNGANEAMLYASGNGHLDVLIWLLSLPNDYSEHDYFEAFRYACYAGKIFTAQYLFSLKPEICINVVKIIPLFLEICKSNYTDVALWFQSLMPFTYFVKTIDIIGWDINTIQKITNYGIKQPNESNTLALITLLEKKGYENQLHADLLNKIANA